MRVPADPDSASLGKAFWDEPVMTDSRAPHEPRHDGVCGSKEQEEDNNAPRDQLSSKDERRWCRLERKRVRDDTGEEQSSSCRVQQTPALQHRLWRCLTRHRFAHVGHVGNFRPFFKVGFLIELQE